MSLLIAMTIVLIIVIVTVILAIYGATLEPIPLMIGFASPIVTTLLTFSDLKATLEHVKDDIRHEIEDTKDEVTEAKQATERVADTLTGMTGPIPVIRPPSPKPVRPDITNRINPENG